MVQVSLQVDLEKLVMQEPIQSGTLNQIFSSETETKHYTFQDYWSLIKGMPSMIKHFSELVKEY